MQHGNMYAGYGSGILAAYARVADWPYTDYNNGGKDWFPGPKIKGIPYSLTYSDPTWECAAPNGIVCSSLTAWLLATAYPHRAWTAPERGDDDTSTYARIQGFRMAAHLREGGGASNAPREFLFDPITALQEVGICQRVLTDIDDAEIGEWVVMGGWRTDTQGHSFIGFRMSADLWLIIESATGGPRQRWRTSGWIRSTYSVALVAGVLIAANNIT